MSYDPSLVKVDDLTTGQTFTSTQIRLHTVQQPKRFRERANTLTVEPPVVRRRISERTYPGYRQPARMRRSPYLRPRPLGQAGAATRRSLV